MIADIQAIDRRALDAGLSLTALAKMASVSNTTLTRWRRGQGVTVRTVNKLVRELERIEANRTA